MVSNFWPDVLQGVIGRITTKPGTSNNPWLAERSNKFYVDLAHHVCQYAFYIMLHDK